MNEIRLTGRLVNAEGLLKELFSEDCRPSLRWLRTQTRARAIPHVRIGHLVFFDVEMVRAHLAERRLVRGRGGGWPALAVGGTATSPGSRTISAASIRSPRRHGVQGDHARDLRGRAVGNHRVTCIDRMGFNAQGLIQLVKITFE